MTTAHIDTVRNRIEGYYSDTGYRRLVSITRGAVTIVKMTANTSSLVYTVFTGVHVECEPQHIV